MRIVGDVESFHPDLRRAARWLPRAPVRPRTLRPIRWATGLTALRPAPDVEVVDLGPTSLRVYPPPGAGTGAALLWIHGGGFVIGAAAQDDDLCRHFAAALRTVVASVDYRLAPEAPFPAPLDDCYDALTWLSGRPDVDRERIAVGGASAGGGLAAGLALLARDRDEIRPVFQLLAYPMLDDRTAARSGIDERGFRLWNNASNRFGWRAYTGQEPGSPSVPALAAPARAPDLSGLPPAWIGVGALDLFHAEDVAYASRLEDDGVDCTLDVVPGAFHGFDLVGRSGVARRFRAAQVAALEAALGRPDPAG